MSYVCVGVCVRCSTTVLLLYLRVCESRRVYEVVMSMHYTSETFVTRDDREHPQLRTVVQVPAEACSGLVP